MSSSKPSLTGKRIIFVLGALHKGGAEWQAIMLARLLKEEAGADVQIWGFSEPGRVSELCDEYGLPWRSLARPLFTGWRIAVHDLAILAWTLRQAHPDILMPYTFVPNLCCGLIWRLTGARLCVWNQEDEGKGMGHRKSIPLAIRLTPRFLANSNASADALKARGVKPEIIRVIHTGVTMNQPKASPAAWRQQLGVTNDTFLACMVANLTSYKDHPTLLKAWRQVVDRFEQSGRTAVLLLAGRFVKTLDELQKLTAQLELVDRVKFLGEVQDIPGLLSTVDLGVYSSISEGLPNAVLEYMACGLAFVGTDIPGIREAAGEQNQKYLSNPGDAGHMARLILDLAMDDPLRREVGISNRKRAESVFSYENLVTETVQFLSEYLGYSL